MQSASTLTDATRRRESRERIRANIARAAANRELGERIAAECAGAALTVADLCARYEARREWVVAALRHVPPSAQIRVVRANGPEVVSRRVGTTAWHVLQAAARGDTIPQIARRLGLADATVRATAVRLSDAGVIFLEKKGGRLRIGPIDPAVVERRDR